MKANKFFRYLWRVDAVLILFAAGAITFGVGVLVFEELGGRAALRHDAEVGVPVAADPAANLNLGHAEAITGTPVLRADLFLYKGGRASAAVDTTKRGISCLLIRLKKRRTGCSRTMTT